MTKKKLPRSALSQRPTSSVLVLAGHFLHEYEEKIRYCLATLDEDRLWWRPGEHTNSVGNLVLHLCGNLSQWILATLAGDPYQRHRANEFEADRVHGRDELAEKLSTVVAACAAVLERTDPEDLAQVREVQSYSTTTLGVVLHAMEHMAYHTGQIVYVTKQLAWEREAFEFYPQHEGE